MRIPIFRAPIVTALSVGLGLSLFACKKDLPSGPSELTAGVTIYEHAHFQGASALLTSDVSNLENYNGPCPHLPPFGSSPQGQH